jgi:hypothetical protein
VVVHDPIHVIMRLAYLLVVREFRWLMLCSRSEAAKKAETLVLARQLAMVRRRMLRSHLIWADRAVLVAWSDWSRTGVGEPDRVPTHSPRTTPSPVCAITATAMNRPRGSGTSGSSRWPCRSSPRNTPVSVAAASAIRLAALVRAADIDKSDNSTRDMLRAVAARNHAAPEPESFHNRARDPGSRPA